MTIYNPETEMFLFPLAESNFALYHTIGHAQRCFLPNTCDENLISVAELW